MQRTESSHRGFCSFGTVMALVAGLALFAGSACRGSKSADPPIHLNPNMDHQARYNPQSANPFFQDGRAMRPPVPGTLARGELEENPVVTTGLAGGAPAVTLPVPLTRELLLRGKERYAIFCSACHGGSGDGQSLVASRGMQVPPPSYYTDRLLAMPVGEIYRVITYGVRAMPPLRQLLPTQDRWAVAAFVRVLQRSRNATLADVPPEVAETHRWRAP
jgi:mono/diheme cytochrome c family protein